MAAPGTAAGKEKVVIIGSGNWGSAIARIVGHNVQKFDKFDRDVVMWVYEELVEGRKLTEIINTTHENVKYLPGFRIPFLPRLYDDIRSGLGEAALSSGRVKGISLIKGMEFGPAGCVLVSDCIRAKLGIPVDVLMGANVANEVAEEQFCEATLGYTNPANALLWRDLLQMPYFRIGLTPDWQTVELCGALKNVVALAAGFCDGLGYGGNTKAALMRIGLREMQAFCREFHGCGELDTFFESCGVADLITTCYGGRNRRVAEAFAKTRRSWEELEAEMLGGQKLQGTLTAAEVHAILVRSGSVRRYPLFNAIYEVMEGRLPPSAIVRMHEHSPSPEPEHPVSRRGSSGHHESARAHSVGADCRVPHK